MADGEINRNGATIRIDDNGGIQVEPAGGEEVEFTGPDTGTDAERESLSTEYSNTTAEVSRRAESGDGSDANPWVLTDDFWAGARRYEFGAEDEENHYTTTGLTAPDDAVDFSETTIALIGHGPRLTRIRLADGGNDPIFDLSATNPAAFGRVEQIELNGNRDNNSAGYGIFNDGLIDLQLVGLFVHDFVEDGIRLNGGSGHRVDKCWVERNNTGLFLAGGERSKVSNSYFSGNDTYGLQVTHENGNFEGNSYKNNATAAIRLNGVSECRENTFNGENIKGGGMGIEIRPGCGPKNTFSDIDIHNTDSYGVTTPASAGPTVFSDLTITDAGDHDVLLLAPGDIVRGVDITRPGGRALHLRGQDQYVADATIVDDTGTTVDALRIVDDNVTVDGLTVRGSSTFQMRFDAVTEPIVRKSDLGWSDLNVDDSVRGLVNGVGKNAGDPSTTGDWNGHADYAERQGAVIHDTVNNNLYRVRDGGWSQIGN